MPNYSLNRYPHKDKKEPNVTDGNNVKKFSTTKTGKEYSQFDDIEVFMQQRSVRRRLETCDSLNYQELIKLSYELNALFPPSTLRCDAFLSSKKKELETRIYAMNKSIYASKYGKDEFKRFMNN